jgi:hypothetical protein
VFDVIVRPLFRSLSRPLFRALTGLVSAITKVLIDLSPTSSSFYSIGSDVVLTTAYKLGTSTVLPTASTTYALYGRASSATDYLKILSSGYLSLDVNGTVVTSTVLSTKDSQYREYSVTLDGNDFTFKENDTVISTVTNATAAAKTLTLNLIGNSNGAEFYLGVLADPVMGSLAFKLNKLTDNFELPVGNVFGSEEVTNGDFATGIAGWSSHNNASIAFSSNRIQVQSDGSLVGNCYQAVTTVIGQAYEFSCILEAAAGSGAVLAVGTTAGASGDIAAVTIEENTTESVSAAFTATTTTTYLRVGLRTITANQSVFSSNISVKSVTNFIAYQNIGTGRSFRETYTLIDDDYFGSQAVVNSDFATDSDWNKGTNITISAGQAVFASAPNNQGIVQSNAAETGRIYDVSVSVSGYVQGGVFVRQPFEESTVVTSNGTFTFTGLAVESTSIFIRADGVTTLNLDSVTVRRKIEVSS